MKLLCQTKHIKMFYDVLVRAIRSFDWTSVVGVATLASDMSDISEVPPSHKLPAYGRLYHPCLLSSTTVDRYSL